MGLTLGRTAASHFLSQVAVSAAGFLATFVIARVLGAEGVGIYALGMSVVVWLNVPLSGFQKALTKRISEGVEPDAFFTAGALLNIASVLVPAILVLALAGYVEAYVGAAVAPLIALVLLTNGLFKTCLDTLHGEKKVAIAGWSRTAERVARTAAQVALLVLNYGVAGLFVGHALALVATAALALYFVDLRPVVPRREHFRRLYEYAKYGWSGGLKGNAFNYMDVVVLGFFVAAPLVGIYRVAWTLSSFLTVISNSVTSTLFPEMSELSTRDRHERIRHYLDEGLVFAGVFLIPGAFGALALGEDLLRIYETEFARGATILVLLVLAQLFHAYASQLQSTIKALDRPDITFRIDVAFLVMNMGLNVVLVWAYGWYGAAVATLASGIVILVMSFYALRTLVGTITVPLREIGVEILAAGGMFLTVTAVESGLPAAYQNHYGTVLLVGLGAALYTALLLALSGRIRGKARSLLLVTS